jgi:hypothetical protein
LTILDIIRLENTVHCGLDLAEELVKVTNRFDIAKYVISMTYDNVSVNDALSQISRRWERSDRRR